MQEKPSQNLIALSNSVKIVTDMTISRGKPQHCNSLAQRKHEHSRHFLVNALYRYAIKIWCVSLKFGYPGDTTRGTERQQDAKKRLSAMLLESYEFVHAALNIFTTHLHLALKKNQQSCFFLRKHSYASKSPHAFPTCTVGTHYCGLRGAFKF